MAHDVFISYSSKDKTIADAVCARLESHGIRCWIAPRDVHPGLPYGEEIIDGIHSSRVMVLVFSANANASPHIPKEIERAVSQGISVIPLRVEDVTPAKSLDYFISSVHWLDALTPPLEKHLDSLASTVSAVLESKGAKPPVPPPNPIPTPLPVPGPTPVPGQKKSSPLFFFGIVGLLIAAAVGWFIWSKSANTDAIVGCWQWFNNVPATINSDGTVHIATFTAQWKMVDSVRRTYTFTWPEAVDNVVIAANDRMLSGSNQYGFFTTGYRTTVGSGMVGSWRWPNGAIVVFRPDGSFNVGTLNGYWRVTNPAARSYALTWPKPVDTITLSTDGNGFKGGNQFGIPVSGLRAPGACNVK